MILNCCIFKKSRAQTYNCVLTNSAPNKSDPVQFNVCETSPNKLSPVSMHTQPSHYYSQASAVTTFSSFYRIYAPPPPSFSVQCSLLALSPVTLHWVYEQYFGVSVCMLLLVKTLYNGKFYFLAPN